MIHVSYQGFSNMASDWLAALPEDHHQTSNVNRTLVVIVGSKIVDHSDVVGAAPTTTSSYST